MRVGDDVGGAAQLALAGEHGAGRLVQRLREGDSALRKPVLTAVPAALELTLSTLEVDPTGHILGFDEIVFVHRACL